MRVVTWIHCIVLRGILDLFHGVCTGDLPSLFRGPFYSTTLRTILAASEREGPLV